ncbi:MAG: galactokinase, partial [Bacteroidales bacterium]|nr:galactokinase [Bacteroidales bacterium]
MMPKLSCETRFQELYHKDPEGVAFCPYRICPIGAHSDHNLGKITGLAIDKGIHVAYRPKENGVVELSSLQFGKRAQWHIAQVPAQRQGDWADYLRGATLVLSRRYPLHLGMSGVIEGSLPIGGLSSSAAVTLSFLSALCRINQISPSATELIRMAVAVENDYVGVSSGKLDQSCELYSKKDHLLYLDTRTDEYELIPTHPSMPEYDILILFSGVERTLAGSAFNMRVDECRSAAYALKALSGMTYGKFAETNLREVPREVYEQYKNQLPETWRRRAEHWYTEFARVEAGAEAWRRGDLETYGRLSFESGWSSINNWETGSPELKTL